MIPNVASVFFCLAKKNDRMLKSRCETQTQDDWIVSRHAKAHSNIHRCSPNHVHASTTRERSRRGC